MTMFLLGNLIFYAFGLIVIGYSRTDHKKTIFRIYTAFTLTFTALFFYLLWAMRNL